MATDTHDVPLIEFDEIALRALVQRRQAEQAARTEAEAFAATFAWCQKAPGRRPEQFARDHRPDRLPTPAEGCDDPSPPGRSRASRHRR